MNLDDFAGADPIFVDANVFTYFALGTTPYQGSCTEFLSKIEQGAALSAACYKVCRDFWNYLTVLQATGLQIVSVSSREQELSMELGSRYLLLPTDALHLATCHHHGVRHLATADAHFEKIGLLQVWKPTQR